MRIIVAALLWLCACQAAAAQAIPLRYGQAYSALRSIFALPLFVAEREGYFVRDTNGTTVPDAKVTVAVKNRGGIVTRTDLLGTYKVPGFGKEVDPKDVEVSCDKPGYKQLRVVRRSTPSTDPKIPIETECTLQRI